MGNLTSGGLGCFTEKVDFEPFQGTGGTVRVLIVALDYEYSPGNELTGTRDGQNMERICSQARCDDVTCLYDRFERKDPRFPSRANVKRALKELGARTKPEDFFVFFYAGHGENVPDHPPLDEADGQDEAFVLPGPRGEIAAEHFFIDDEFVHTIEDSFPKDCRILCILDCCHSATMADIDSHHWDHRICSISACQDHEESTDTGSGGLLTIAIEKTLAELSVSRGEQEYSIKSLYDRVVKYAAGISREQGLELSYANMDPEETPWPLPRPWWRHFERGLPSQLN
eukprot:TRINITY_DN47122_c0_g1_i1.p1 TRINITY_DN47122_c0_g1~~TRINITY_DN47122_c0_g1_i1.p1  ORF type:complete len:285 (-),score=66.20 TRINITY_DN47122_c0_g1_i1:104-958(-)